MKSIAIAPILLAGLISGGAAFLSPKRSAASFTQGNYLYDPDRHGDFNSDRRGDFNFGTSIDFEQSAQSNRDRNRGGSPARGHPDPFGDAESATSFRDRSNGGLSSLIARPSDAESVTSFRDRTNGGLSSLIAPTITSPSNSPLARSGAKGGALGEIWNNASPVIVQGGSLRTFQFADPAVDAIQVLLKSRGRPIDADVELWQGPNNTPHKMKIYVEDGAMRTFNAVVGTPRGPNTVTIRNTGQIEFPVDAVVRPDNTNDNLALSIASVMTAQGPQTIQGGAIRTFPFDPSVDSVAIILKTDGRPLNARIELLQGPNTNKQVVELYTEDGTDRPFFAIIETPGSGNVVRIVNSAPLEFPLYASVDAYMVADERRDDDGYSMIQGNPNGY